jgi:arginyl-tRNA--protein-N-Asp/Glu arginylyltransferase
MTNPNVPNPKYFNDYFIADRLSLIEWDCLLNEGWDRVGYYFFRKRYDAFEGFNQNLDFIRLKLELMPLRFALDKTFAFSKSQRILQRKNSDLQRYFRRATINDEKLLLFEEWHKARFGGSTTAMTEWINGDNTPFPSMECALYDKDKLVAVSFFDETRKSNYSTLAFYTPEEARRSLGTYTMISEIEFGLAHKKKFHYPGHAHHENTMYNYKKQFCNGEYFDWETETWLSLKK